MKKLSLIATLILLTIVQSKAQNYLTKTGYVSFFSSTPVEDIKAQNYKVTSRINTESGDVVFSIPIQSFEFEKALMQKHFNEEMFMDSKTYPKAKFKGSIVNIDAIDLSKNGTYEVDVKGQMSIRGTEKEDFLVKATLVVTSGKIEAYSKFNVRVADFGVEMPAKKKENLAEFVEVELKLNYDPQSA